MMSLMHFWGVGFAAFGWLVFKIAKRMLREQGSTDLLQDDEVAS